MSSSVNKEALFLSRAVDQREIDELVEFRNKRDAWQREKHELLERIARLEKQTTITPSKNVSSSDNYKIGSMEAIVTSPSSMFFIV